MSSLTYLTAVGYSSTVAAFTTLPPMPAHMSAINAYTCISGLSVSMQIIPPKPLPTKTTTVAWNVDKIYYIKFIRIFFWHMNLHKIGNFPTLLIKRPITAKPMPYKISRMIPCSSVANSSFVMQTY